MMKHQTSRPTMRHAPARLGTGALMGIIIAASAPLTVLAGGLPTNFAVAGILGVPLAYLALGVVIALFSVGYSRMATAIRTPGAFSAFITLGLGMRQGIAGAVLALVCYNLMQIGLIGMFGFSAAAALEAIIGLSVPWWVTGAAGWLIVAVLGLRNVDFSAKILGVLVSLEFVVVIIVSVLGLTHAPEGLNTQTLLPSQFFTPGIGVLLAFAIAAFMGFESGAIYSSEARPGAVSRATYAAVTVISLFYAASAWALAMAIGPSHVVNEARALGPDLVFIWLEGFSPVLSDISHLIFVTSLLAALIAFHNAASRYFFSLGAASPLLPSWLSSTNSAGAPVGGSLAQSGLAIIIVSCFVVAGQGSELGSLFPVATLFTWFTNAAAFGLVFLLSVTSVAVMRWSRGTHPEFGKFSSLIAPSVAAAALFIVAILILANFDLMIDSEANPLMVWIMPGIIIISGVIGLVWGEITLRRHPEAQLSSIEPEQSAIGSKFHLSPSTTNAEGAL